MASAAPPPHQPAYLTNTTSLLQTFTDFLTVAIHTILYSRGLYPDGSFISTRKYNFPVRQNRHPEVCAWINNAVASTSTLLTKGTVRAIILVVFNHDNEVMERFMFDVSKFPVVDPKEGLTDFEARKDKEGQDLPVGVSRADVEEQLRATIRKLAYGAEKLSPLPEDCSYSLAVELRDEADPPIGHPQPWIPSEPSLQTGEKTSERIGTDLGGVKSIPVRLVEAGEFILETWIEEGKAKLQDEGG